MGTTVSNRTRGDSSLRGTTPIAYARPCKPGPPPSTRNRRPSFSTAGRRQDHLQSLVHPSPKGLDSWSEGLRSVHPIFTPRAHKMIPFLRRRFGA